MRHAARVDANQAAIVSALRAAGASMWQCAGGCGKTEKRPPSKAARLMCAPCKFKSQFGAANPNYSNAGQKRCLMCGVDFQSYNDRRYCSQHCYRLTRKAVPSVCPKPPPTPKPIGCPRPPRAVARMEKNCLHCAKPFFTYISRPRTYCSYPCHLASGGAWRAGMESKKAAMKYGAKKDANHAEIVAAWRAAGASVIDMSHVGGGFPDCIVGFAGATALVEIKNLKTSYGRKGLNKNQLKWRGLWTGGPYAVVTDVDGALRLVATMKEVRA